MRNLRSIARSPSPANQRGMSLIEIIIVIVLIGAVLAFVGNRVIGGKDRGDYNIAKAQVQTLAGKVDSFQMDTGRLPTSLDELVTQPGDVTGWLGPYAKATEIKDPWGHPIEYRAPGEGRPYDLVMLGKDGKTGGSSTDADFRYE
ncbi:type II secretion system major pseudopilin GspG [Montanilutibacter psychrotolerans]|uniref:Type II secretion system core protein G n=1 Tax=Montanilutibacter psychrotolerans TaxID=1327343 RepID=A0A3M8SV41_9GAMM|nr:type II secretion system major pseudopilin GspG [Lysobacter psychrotolerans]RNF84555.1 type II secretion system protein GspG [Lysobacter psychrotolerans]